MSSTPNSLTRRSFMTRLTGLMLIPASVSVVSTQDLQAGGVAVRGPRGGSAAVSGSGRGPVRSASTNRGPASVHGTARRTARRTSRRTARRTTRRLYTLPRGYTTTVIGGVTYYVASKRYYEAVYEGGKVVYIEIEFDD